MPNKLKKKLPPLELAKETIGQRIARFRKERGYTQKELAEKIGILHTLVSDYERGKIRLYDEMVTRFAIALEVTTDEILGRKEDKHSNTTPSLRIMKKLSKIESLPPSRQKILLKTIDVFLECNTE